MAPNFRKYILRSTKKKHHIFGMKYFSVQKTDIQKRSTHINPINNHRTISLTIRNSLKYPHPRIWAHAHSCVFPNLSARSLVLTLRFLGGSAPRGGGVKGGRLHRLRGGDDTIPSARAAGGGPSATAGVGRHARGLPHPPPPRRPMPAARAPAAALLAPPHPQTSKATLDYSCFFWFQVDFLIKKNSRVVCLRCLLPPIVSAR